MRPTTSTMLQQNNNNNYPCLNVSGSTREMLQKCSRASLPFPSRLELGLGDLPLIRGLRAWALCSKNRRKAGGLLGGGQAPTAPPVGRGGSTSCPRPADVYLSGEWGRMGYGLPLGLDAGQAGIGALVTVATLKTSEGSGKTQTQCLFLRTEKGSCLYSTAKPGSGVTAGAASSVVGGWLRGKTGGGGGGGSRDTTAGRRDHGPSAPAQTGANRVRVRSGRRWRKSCNAASREKAGVSRERQQSSREHPVGESALEERQEERDKGGPDSKQFPSPQPDSRRSRQEREGAFRSPRCCHNASPKTCSQCGRRAQRRESQDEQDGSESPRGGVANRPSGEVKGMRRERQKNEEEEEELASSHCALAEPNADLESKHFHPEEIRDGGSNDEEPKTQTSHGKDERSEDEEDTNSEVMKILADSDSNHVPPEQVTDDFTSGHSGGFEKLCGETVNGFPERLDAHQELDEGVESVDAEEEAGSISQTPAAPDCHREVSVSAAHPESSAPAEGSTCSAEHEACRDLRGDQVADCGIMGKEELDDKDNTVNEDGKPLFFSKSEEISSRPEERHVPSSPSTLGDEPVWEEEQQEENIEQVWRSCNEQDADDGPGDDDKGRCIEDDTSDTQVDDDGGGVTRACALAGDWRLQESVGGCRRSGDGVGDTCGPTGITQVEANETGANVTNVACADPSTANPAPSLPPLGSMATGLPCLEAEEEEEGVRAAAGEEDGGWEGKRRHRRELEEQGEEERGYTVATEEGRKQEEEEEEEDEFGVFMQAEGEPAWSEGSTMSASVPCGSRETVALGNHAIAGESPHWTPGWTDSSFHQSDDTWTAFPQDSSNERRDAAGPWWPTSAMEESRDRLPTNQNLAAVFADAFPSPPPSPSSDLDAVPTLTQLLRGNAGQDQGLLDSFHDLNKMICQRYKRASGVSRDLLLKTLHLERPHAESRPAPRTANRRLSPGLPSANQHAQIAAAKRRLSYDYNRNIME